MIAKLQKNSEHSRMAVLAKNVYLLPRLGGDTNFINGGSGIVGQSLAPGGHPEDRSGNKQPVQHLLSLVEVNQANLACQLNQNNLRGHLDNFDLQGHNKRSRLTSDSMDNCQPCYLFPDMFCLYSCAYAMLQKNICFRVFILIIEVFHVCYF